jgi:hypothetical protein
MPRHIFSILAVVTTLAACHLPPTSGPVPVQGGAGDRRLLAGQWSGRYWSEVTGRHGTIRFSLAEPADTGFGQVEMTFSPTLKQAQVACSADPKNPSSNELDPRPCTALDIRVVAVEGDRVRGTMVPYWDPDCNCRTRTEFEGKLSGDQINGTFTSRRESPGRKVVTGAWTVERERS